MAETERLVLTQIAVTAGFKGVLLDWRGTLAVAPSLRSWVEMAMARIGRVADAAAVEEAIKRLNAVDTSLVESSVIDTDVELHRSAYETWFADAGLDAELATSLYAVESDASTNPFAEDAGNLLRSLHRGGVQVGIVSDIHFDLRPAFAQHQNSDGSTWAGLIDAWVLSFEVGVAKPDPSIFNIALEQLGLPARDVLMVGDRAGGTVLRSRSGSPPCCSLSCEPPQTSGCIESWT